MGRERVVHWTVFYDEGVELHGNDSAHSQFAMQSQPLIHHYRDHRDPGLRGNKWSIFRWKVLLNG